VTTEAAFLELESDWTELWGHVRHPSPFHSWDFAVEWWRHFVLGRSGRATGAFDVVVVHDRLGRTIGIVPLFAERRAVGSVVGVRLQPFGRSYSFEPMSDEPITLFREGHEQAAVAAVKDHLASRAGARTWDVAVVRDSLQDFRDSLSLSGRRCVELDRSAPSAMSIRLPSTWQLFRSRLSKSMRDNLAFYSKRMAREVGPWKIRTARTPGEVGLATDALISLHRQRSRSPLGIPHCNHIPTAVHASFVRHWFQRLARRGAVSLVFLETRKGIRAAQAFIEGPDCGSVYYSGFDEDVYRFSALTLITAEWLRGSIAAGLSRIYFPPGSSAWAARWGAQPGPEARETSIYAINAPALIRAVVRRYSGR
jgi:hypothetical protein